MESRSQYEAFSRSFFEQYNATCRNDASLFAQPTRTCVLGCGCAVFSLGNVTVTDLLPHSFSYPTPGRPSVRHTCRLVQHRHFFKNGFVLMGKNYGLLTLICPVYTVSLIYIVDLRMIREDGQFGLIAACAAGGQGVGMIMERHPDASL